MRYSILILTLYLLPLHLFSGELLFHENKGQFPLQVKYKASLNNGALYVEQDQIVFLLHDPTQLEALKSSLHGEQHDKHAQENKRSQTSSYSLFNSHAFALKWTGANPNCKIRAEEPTAHHYNYFLGKDPAKWAKNIKAFRRLVFENIYPETDLILYQKEDQLKYEFIVKPGGDPQKIQIDYEGIEKLGLDHGRIRISTSVGPLYDQDLYCFQTDDSGNQHEIESSYRIIDQTVQFKLASYQLDDTLIVDPVLNFSTFSGSTLDNWGFTATYDQSGNSYGAGVVFGAGYPATLGAFQSTFAGGNAGGFGAGYYGIDISISKFSADGSTLIYATYLGGTEQEMPHSLIVDQANNLFVFGTTSSNDFPITSSAYDPTYNGGPEVIVDNVLRFLGSDMFITKLSVTGDALLGSTYYGGSSTDGFNDPTQAYGLMHNYADFCRGEIILDAAGDVYIASSTNSADLPIVGGFQSSFGGGGQDGCIAKFNSDLSGIVWSSFLGGAAADGVYGLQSNSAFELYVTGGTRSSSLSTPSAAMGVPAGDVDGFVAKVSNDGSSLEALSYLGSAAYDQGYYVQIDDQDKIFVYGQTEGNLPVSAGVFANPNSGQFIHKYSSDLTTLELSTVVGSGSGTTDIVPTAFLVNYCGQIYISGWGGNVNYWYGGGSTNGMPISADAHQAGTDGSDFYLMVLERDMAALNYATYFGSNTAAEHVDGGTSRFDKNGVVYQAVCAACGNTTAFPTTTGAYAETMNSPNCNMAVFKFDASSLTAGISTLNDTNACAGEQIVFFNSSNGGTNYEWTFHDGTVSLDQSPSKTYTEVGDWPVRLVVFDPTKCPASDTTYMTIHVAPIDTPQLNYTDTTLCFGETLTFNFSDTNTYVYIPDIGKSITSGDEVTIAPLADTYYTITIANSPCPASLTLPIKVIHPPAKDSVTMEICQGDTTGAKVPYQSDFNYRWIPSNNLSHIIDSVTFFPTDSTTYLLEITGRCGIDTLTYVIPVTEIEEVLVRDTTVCRGENVNLYVRGGTDYTWLGVPSGQEKDSTLSFAPDSTTRYEVLIEKNGCFETHPVNVTVIGARPQPDQFSEKVCQGVPVSMSYPLQNDFQYEWSPSAPQSFQNGTVVFSVSDTTTYLLTIRGECDTAEISYQLNPTIIEEFVVADTTVCRGENVSLYASGGTNYSWQGVPVGMENLSSLTFAPDSSDTYEVTLEKEGCTETHPVNVTVIGARPVPGEFEQKICQGDEIEFTYPQQADFSYQWSPSSPAYFQDGIVRFAPNDSTTYTLSISGDCGTAAISYNIPVTVINDTVFEPQTACIGDSMTLFAGGGQNYSWTPSDNLMDAQTGTPSFLITTDQVYTVSIEKEGCSVDREVPIKTFYKKPQTVNGSYTIQYGDKQEFGLLDEYSYQWTPGTFLSCQRCHNPVSEPDRDMTYYFTYTDENNCSITDSVKVNVIFELYIPNAFSPDGDNLNDVFYAYSHLIAEFEMEIFDRWGEQVFYSNDINVGWDGTLNQHPAQVDVYVYKIRYRRVHTRNVIEKVGTVTLVR